MMAEAGMHSVNPREMVSSLRKEMNLIKAEEMFLKKQILSLNDQFQDLMISVAKLYPDILNEDFAQKPDKSPLQILDHDPSRINCNDSLRRTERKSRWNEWREGRSRRRSFFDGELSKERHHLSKLHTAERPSSIHVDSQLNKAERSPRHHRSHSEPRCESPQTPDEQDTKFYSLDSERRRRIRQRLKESRKTLDVVHLGLF
ncbi:uncharacterized protein LOC110249693 [Exaiptasia diaphana]|uniref:Uncharacterized protein n=1 Tax=Exaiptasia diaphana TaxID=2652724 RepID=A0A913XXQ2_EXADI|nr:uncharacterized protein LOC110249693 [Exaiptasia diaphana]KXJ23888.1 hypothetical protein AC249_AIPGENE15422 [Exaiptasia diaphana]